jgi:(R,R)-butanediol dehydrogenase / meso-butanediol dehydrogenase / diacetyl reductase
MKAALYDAPGKPLKIEAIAEPQPGPDDLILRVAACGICGSDLHLADADGTRGMPPLPHGALMGHEFAGRVVAAGRNVRDAWPDGTRVTALPVSGCGNCMQCLSGTAGRCASAKLMGLGVHPGAYAEYVRVSALETFRLPENIDDRTGATVEPLAVGLHAVEIARISRGEDVLILGAGPIGLAVAAWCRFFGARNVIVSDLVTSRLDRAAAMGATDGIDASTENVAERSRAIAGVAPRVVFDCVGVPGTQQLAMNYAPIDGRVIVAGVCMEFDRILPVRAIVKELQVNYVFAYGRQDFAFTIGMLAAGRISSASMISGSTGFDGFPASFELLKTSKSECKVFLEP